MNPTGWRASAAMVLVATAVSIAGVLTNPTVVRAAAQDGLTQEQLRKMYDDALVQLKASQDRKAELAGENEKLQARVAELEKQLAEARGQISEHAERTFFYRSQHAAWQTFLQRYPTLMQRWKLFLEAGILTTPNEIPQWMDPDWPLSAAEVVSGKSE
jgi:hypothetical protein